MKYTNRFAALTLAATMSAGFVTMPFAAHASEEGKRNTAIGLGVAAAALLLTQKNKVPGAIVAAGAVVAATQIGSDHDRYRRDRDYGYDNRYYDNRRYNDDYYNDRDRYNRDGNRYNDGQGRYRVGDGSASYHEHRTYANDGDYGRNAPRSGNREVRKAR